MPKNSINLSKAVEVEDVLLLKWNTQCPVWRSEVIKSDTMQYLYPL